MRIHCPVVYVILYYQIRTVILRIRNETMLIRHLIMVAELSSLIPENRPILPRKRRGHISSGSRRMSDLMRGRAMRLPFWTKNIWKNTAPNFTAPYKISRMGKVSVIYIQSSFGQEFYHSQ